MFGKKDGAMPQSKIDSLIGQETRIEGNVSFTGGIRVDGHIVGNVVGAGDQPSMLVLSEQARIEGEIRVSHVIINGTVSGPVHALEYLELQSKAKVTGDVHYKKMEIQVGAVVEGNLVHRDSEYSERVVSIKKVAD